MMKRTLVIKRQGVGVDESQLNDNNGKFLMALNGKIAFASVSSLGVGNTITSGTTGSVLFVGSAGVLQQDNANLFWDDTNNRLGIGTTAPSNKLAISDGTIAGIDLIKTGAIAGTAQILNDGLLQIVSNSGNDSIFYRGANHLFSNRSTSTEYMRITNAGRLGINTTNPKNKLDVLGAAVIGATYAGTATAPTSGLLVEGNVGIGTTGPSYRLSVAIDDSATATVTDVLGINHSSSGTPAASFGTGILFTGESSTTDAQNMARIQAIWTTATHASRASALQFQTLTAAGSLTTQLTIDGTGTIQIVEAGNIQVGTSTGTKFGTATSQKLSLWNATPIIQPTTSITAASFVTNTSGTLDDSATWGGYTVGQVIAALKAIGLLA